jgi:NitT/TauT family transport system substrate-binding protein
MDRRSWIAGAVAGVAGLVPLRVVRAQSIRPLVLGDALGDPFAEGYFAIDTGIFRNVGLTIDLQSFTSGSQMAEAVNVGAIDVGITTPIQIANAVARGVPLTIIAPGAISTPTSPSTVMVVGGGAPLKTAKDFEGRTVAVNSLRTVSEVGLDAWLTANGADVSKVRVIEMTMPQMGPAIEHGTIDAGIENDPSLSNALKNNGVRVFLDPNLAIAPRFLGSCWFTTLTFAQNNRDVVKRFGSAMTQTARWANAHRAESGEILAKYGKFDLNLVRNMARSQFAEELRLSDIQPELDAAARFGALARRVTAAEIVFEA